MREFASRCLAHGPEDGVNPTAIPELSIYRRNAISAPASAVYQPSIFLVAQGKKQALVGEDAFVYDPDHYLVTSVPLPVVSQILAASSRRPFLSLAIAFDIEAVRELMSRAGDALAPSATEPPQRGLASCPVTAPIHDIATRLLDLLDQPEDIPVLAPLYLRELLYQVLKGPAAASYASSPWATATKAPSPTSSPPSTPTAPPTSPSPSSPPPPA